MSVTELRLEIIQRLAAIEDEQILKDFYRRDVPTAHSLAWLASRRREINNILI